MTPQPDHLSIPQALALCTRQEDQFFDRKSCEAKGKPAQKITVAFGNSEGGEVAFGIKDEREEPDPSKRICLFQSIEDANSILQSLFEINPPLNLRYQFATIENHPGYLLRIFVDKSQHVHAAPDGTVYRRVGASSLPIKDPNEIAQLAFAKGAISFENQRIEDAQPEVIADSAQNKYLTSSIPEGPDPLSFALNEGLIDRVDWRPMVAGVLLLADHPQGLVPTRCEVRIVFYDTKLEKPEREHLKINETISGPLYDLIKMSVDRVTDILSDISIITPTGLEKVQYPPEAIHEIITNSIIHRDYSISDDIQIIIFQDRIEVLSPGTLPGFVNLNNILDVRYSRNPKIVRTLRRYPNPPNQDLGEGLNTAFQKMQDRRLKPPVLQIEQNYLRVVIAHAPLASPEEIVVEHLKNNDHITNAQGRELTGIKSENQMKEVLYRLRDRGIIELDPERRGNKARWIKK